MEGVEAPVMDQDAEQIEADEAVGVAFADVDGTVYESGVAEMFMDYGDGMDVGAEDDDKMVMSLTTAGVTVEKAKICAASMCRRAPTTTFIEVYGRSIEDPDSRSGGQVHRLSRS